MVVVDEVDDVVDDDDDINYYYYFNNYNAKTLYVYYYYFTMVNARGACGLETVNSPYNPRIPKFTVLSIARRFVSRSL